MAVNFSSNDQDVILKKIDVEKDDPLSDINVNDFYEIERCIKWIKSNNYSCVALQFPDNFLKNSSEISLIIGKEVSADIYVLGDTSYGSCCVDEVAAEHVSADAIIHFGHSCLSPTSRLPVLYIFGKYPIDTEDMIHKFQSLFKDKDSKIIVFCEVFYIYAIGNPKEEIKKDYKNVVFSEIHIPDKPKEEDEPTCTDESCIRKSGQIINLLQDTNIESYNILYIGSQQQRLMNLMLSFNTCKFYSYDPHNKIARQETLDVNKYLRKRYYYIEKAKDAKLVGILVGTLGVSNYLSAIDHLRTLCKNAGKKSYVIVVGKLNVAKLANFSEIDVFVYVSCRVSCIVDSHDFYRPIVTPFELEIAYNQARQWTGEYITDFSQLLPGASIHVPLTAMDDNIGDVSLVTGKYRSLGIQSQDDTDDSNSSAVTVRSSMTVADIHSNAAGEHLANRIWQGLEQHLGETPVSKVIEGKKGIASLYEGEG